jgi:hypothetical protein
MISLSINDYLDGLQKVNTTTEETIFKLRLYLEEKQLKTVIFLIIICLENSLIKQRSFVNQLSVFR